ncbi:MAG: SGNH/GDSL hydrolase family protein [Hydrococcus sp. Prado102]|jgi:phospholipase/lecithinase/hemolysin|nr:SGNH/GDSL hydrolase family protein [Hydrococcus sp. Prado102]
MKIIGSFGRSLAIATGISLALSMVLTQTAIATTLGFQRMFVFGDSLSDTGNFLNLTGGALPNQPFYSPGRFSNGDVWVDYLADSLKVSDTNVTNFALGGATTGSNNVGLPGTPAGLEQQIDTFTGSLGGQSADPNALYIVWAGANDYLGRFSSNPVEPVGNLSDAINTLVARGARNILVPNLPDLGKTPLGRSLDPNAAFALNSLTTQHNKNLNLLLRRLSRTYPKRNFISFNVNALFKQFIANSQANDDDDDDDDNRFRFANVTDGCTNTNLYDPTIPLDPSKLTVCDRPETYLFWDSVHPTTTAHKIIADSAFGVLRSRFNFGDDDDDDDDDDDIELSSTTPIANLPPSITDLPVTFVPPVISASSTKVPEPTFIFGLLAVGTFGIGSRLLKRL